MTYFYLFIEFFKIGLFSVGGGMATVPFLLELSDKYNWYTPSEFANMVAISQSTPGPVGINMATYAGYQAGGVLGAFLATGALVLPALIIMVIIAKFLQNFKDSPLVKAIFSGIRPVVAALILWAVWELCQLSLFSTSSDGSLKILWINLCLCILVFFFLQLKKLKNLHPLLWILAGAIMGILLNLA